MLCPRLATGVAVSALDQAVGGFLALPRSSFPRGCGDLECQSPPAPVGLRISGGWSSQAWVSSGAPRGLQRAAGLRRTDGTFRRNGAGRGVTHGHGHAHRVRGPEASALRWPWLLLFFYGGAKGTHGSLQAQLPVHL